MTSKLVAVLKKQHGDWAPTMATTLGVGLPTVYAWRQGRRIPRPKDLPAIAAQLGVPVEDITGDLPPRRKPGPKPGWNKKTGVVDYEAVLRDLERKRADIDAAIAGVKVLLGLLPGREKPETKTGRPEDSGTPLPLETQS